MSSNSNNSDLPLYKMGDMIFVYALLIASVSVSIVLASYILMIIYLTKSLYSPANLLVFNTSMVTIFLVIVCTVNVTYFFIEEIIGDYECRVLAYVTYVAMTLVAYSYVIQSVSRLFFTVFPQHRSMLSYKSHFLLIFIQTIGSFLIPLASIVTEDVIYRPLAICLIPIEHMIHVAYFFVSSYFVPLFIIVAIYLIIHRRVRLSSRILHHALRSSKRDLRLTRNIVILFLIFLFAGFPAFIYLLATFFTSLPLFAFYMFTFTATCLASAVEKLTVILLNKDLRKETRKRIGHYIPCFRMNRTAVETFTLAGASIFEPIRSTANIIRKRPD